MKNIPSEEDNFYCLEDDNNINKEDEFDSQFDFDEKLVEEEMDQTMPEMPFFDLQFTDTLKTALKDEKA